MNHQMKSFWSLHDLLCFVFCLSGLVCASARCSDAPQDAGYRKDITDGGHLTRKVRGL